MSSSKPFSHQGPVLFLAPLTGPHIVCQSSLFPSVSTLKPQQNVARFRPRILNPTVTTPVAAIAPPSSDAATKSAERGVGRTTKDVLIFIHGITTSTNPADSGSDDQLIGQLESYEKLYDGVANVMKGTTKGEEWKNAEVIKVLWGFKGKDGDGNPLKGDHTLLAEAERFFGKATDKLESDNQKFTLNPFKWALRNARSPLRYGIADMFFYVSRAGRPLVRKAVARQIMNENVKNLVENGKTIELTLLGHSAGSVVAHDFVFFIHNSKSKTDEEIKEACNSFADDDPELIKDLYALVQHARAGKLKVRKLFTFGSPLHLLFIRSVPVLRDFASGRGMDPADYGLKESYAGSSYPRWLNILDSDDPIAGPVEGAIDAKLNESGTEGRRIVEDIFLDTARWIAKAHGSYWRSEEFAKTVGDHW